MDGLPWRKGKDLGQDLGMGCIAHIYIEITFGSMHFFFFKGRCTAAP